jgi:hypothetical protein
MTKTLDELFALYDVDKNIDQSQLGVESLKTHQLKQKYYKLFVDERKALRLVETKLRQLRKDKKEFYTRGKVLKTEVEEYLATDKDIINLTLEVADIQEKVDYLEFILQDMKARGYSIPASIRWHELMMGK